MRLRRCRRLFRVDAESISGSMGAPLCVCVVHNKMKPNKTKQKAKEIEPLSVLSLSWQVRARVLFRVPVSMSAMIDVARSICQADQTKTICLFALHAGLNLS